MIRNLNKALGPTLRKASRCASKLMGSTDQPLQMRAVNGHSAPGPDLKPCNTYLQSKGTNVFSVMTALSVEHKSVNLGQVRHLRSCVTRIIANIWRRNMTWSRDIQQLMQGFPDEEGPEEMKRRAGSAILEHHNQYPPMHGIPELRQVRTVNMVKLYIIAQYRLRIHGLRQIFECDHCAYAGCGKALSNSG